MPRDLKWLATEIVKLRETKEKISKIEKECNLKLEQYSAEVLALLDASGMPHVEYEGICRITRREKQTIFISDMSKLAKYVKSVMTNPNSTEEDTLNAMSLVQARAQQTNIAALLETGVAPETLGVAVKRETGISVSKR